MIPRLLTNQKKMLTIPDSVFHIGPVLNSMHSAVPMTKCSQGKLTWMQNKMYFK